MTTDTEGDCVEALPDFLQATMIKKLARSCRRWMRQVVRFLSEECSGYWRTPNKKPIRDQIREMQELMVYYRFVPYHYVKHGLFRRDVSGFLGYIPPGLVTRFCGRINATGDLELVRNKAKFANHLKAAGIPAIDTLFTVYRNGVIEDSEGGSVSFDEFLSRLGRQRLDDIFVKPVCGAQGRGARKLSLEGARLIYKDDKLAPADFHSLIFSDHRDDRCLVQPFIDQHPTLREIYPSSVNTVRIDSLG